MFNKRKTKKYNEMFYNILLFIRAKFSDKELKQLVYHNPDFTKSDISDYIYLKQNMNNTNT